MEKIVEHGLLYDFYGELLTAHQRQIYEDAVYHDMSLTEIADIQGISRQGVHDLIRRCDKILEQYEEKLGLVRKFALVKEKVQRIDALARELSEREMQDAHLTSKEALGIKTIAEHLAAIRTLSGEIMEEL